MSDSSHAFLFEGAHLVLPDKVIPASRLAFRDGRICSVGKKIKGKKIPAQGLYLAPGFIDLHIHGALGRDTMDCSFESWDAISRFHASGGTTSLALTTVAAPHDEIEEVLEIASLKPRLSGARLLGIHIEGPYLSPEKRGAHLPELLKEPADLGWKKWLRHKGSITQVSFAPELAGGITLARELRKLGIIASAAHTNASDFQFQQARKAGLDNATHLFNCMSTSMKIGPLRIAGVLESALADTEVHTEVIADGYHVHPTLLRMAYRAKGADHITLITDATSGAGLKKGTVFTVGDGVEARVEKNMALTSDGASLAGSVIRMIDNIRTMVEKVGVPLHEAVCMATLNPARRIRQEKQMGSLLPGRKADFVLFDSKFRVRQTWRDGKIVFKA